MVAEGDKWSLDNTDGEFFLGSKKKKKTEEKETDFNETLNIKNEKR